MDNLVEISNDQVVTSSRNVARDFNKRHYHVVRDIEKLIISTTKNGVPQNMFYEREYKHEQNKQTYKEYLINRDGFTLLAMGFTGDQAIDFKMDYMKAFNQMEEILNSPEMIVQRAMEIQQEKIIALTTENNELKPKALFAEAVETSKSSVLVGELAKIIKQNGVEIGQNRLFNWLRENGFLISRKGEAYNQPTQKSMDQGLFEIKKRTINNPDGSIRTTSTSKVTGKGQIYFVKKFISEIND